MLLLPPNERPISHRRLLFPGDRGGYLEGLGVFAEGRESIEWPGGDIALLAILPLWSVVSWIAATTLRSPRRAVEEPA